MQVGLELLLLEKNNYKKYYKINQSVLHQKSG